MLSWNSAVVAATLLLPAARAVTEESSLIVLEDFSNPQHAWQQMNDPVMGGQSTGTFEVKENGIGYFIGNVAIVPFLKAPGFIKVETTKGESWPDASSCEGLQLTAKASTDYAGYRVSFGKNRPPSGMPYTYGYKTDMPLAMGDDFVDLRLPFKSFTDNWDAATGDAVVTCEEDSQYCPDEATKKDLYSIAIWGEGIEGDVHLGISMIAAYGCNDSPDVAPVKSQQAPLTTSLSVPLVTSDEIMIEDFSSAVNSWQALNDPVMGGQSDSSVVIKDGLLNFEGTCAIVPFLKAPGFITAVTGRDDFAIFPDVSTCTSLKVVLRTNVQYMGYYLSFGRNRVDQGHHAMGYKTPLDSVPSGEFGEMILPFSSFSSKWNDATGKTEVKCSEDSQYCPTTQTLQNMETMSFWGEGVEGNIALEIKSISAIGCASDSSYLPSMGVSESPPKVTLAIAAAGATSNSSDDSHDLFVVGQSTMAVAGLCFALGFAFAYAMLRTKIKQSTYEEVTLEAAPGASMA